nr:SDR family NAD(P)-dependent oxidoreductase [Bacillus sp. 03113]
MDDESFLHTYQLDVSEYEEVSNFFSYIETKHFDVDSLVNNAGIYLAKNIMEYQEADIDKILGIMLRDSFFSPKCSARNSSRDNVEELLLICLQYLA